MAKYDWPVLKRKYITGDYKSLRDFAIKENIPYNKYFRDKTKGWAKEKDRKTIAKQSHISERVTAAQIDHEVDLIVASLALSRSILTKTNDSVQAITPGPKAVYPLKAASEIAQYTVKTARLCDEASGAGSNQSLVDAMKSGYIKRMEEGDA